MSLINKVIIPLITSGSSDSAKVKVTVIGVGSVGMAIAFTVMTKAIANVLALIDFDENKVKGEVLDMQQGSQYLDTCKVIGGKDYCHSKNSDVVFIAAGVRQKEGESRLNLVQRNLQIYKTIVPEIVKYSPNCIIIVVSNPVDVLTYVTWKLSGFERNRVIGSGTILDSARFRHNLSQKLRISASAVHGYIIGEHGDSSVAVWSKVSIGGVNLVEVYPKLGSIDDPENFADIHEDVKNSAYEIIRLKGYTSWAIGLCCANLCHAIIHNRKIVVPVSTNVKGLYGIDYDVYLSLPCIVGSSGVESVINVALTETERNRLNQSATTLKNTAEGLQW